jgi:hypothetical protein
MARKPIHRAAKGPPARVFFSHSTDKGTPDRDILTALVDSLRAKYAILLDRETLVAGEDWRSTLNVWIGSCDAAVILVTSQSAESEFCQYEWSILSYRRRNQGQFLVIPIYYGITPEKIAGKPHQISEIAAHFQFDNIANVSRQVAASLRAINDKCPRPAEKQARYIASLLKRCIDREDVIDDAAARIKLDLGMWDPLVDKWLNFAIKLMGVGLDRARPALRDLRQYINEGEFKELIQLIGCSWVDYRSAQRVAENADRERADRIPLGLNAEHKATAECYVLSASGRAPSQNWGIGETHWMFQTYPDLRNQVRTALIQALQLTDEEDQAKALERELAIRERDKQPVFVVLRTTGLGADWLGRLRADNLFAGVSFFVLTGQAGGPHQLTSVIEPLEPPLSSGFESKFWDNYEDTTRTFRLR